MGFIEETGAAQYYRDARILTIYEGTTAIQANDLLGRKTLKDKAAVPLHVATQMDTTEQAVHALGTEGAIRLAAHLRATRATWLDVIAFMQSRAATQPNAAYAGSVPYLLMSAQAVAGWQMARSYLYAQAELDAGQGDRSFMLAKQATALFYADHILSLSPAWRSAIIDGADSVMALSVDAF
jgi:hypothetical protein